MKKIIYTRPDGNISIIIPAKKTDIEKSKGRSITDEEYKALVEKAIPADALNVRELEDFDLPVDREFRNAWEDSQPGNQIDINCQKARDVALEELRLIRNKLLDETDKEYMKALELGEDLTALKAERQRLRDLTEPLKTLDVVDKYNNEELLNLIKVERDKR